MELLSLSKEMGAESQRKSAGRRWWLKKRSFVGRGSTGQEGSKG